MKEIKAEDLLNSIKNVNSNLNFPSDNNQTIIAINALLSGDRKQWILQHFSCLEEFSDENMLGQFFLKGDAKDITKVLNDLHISIKNEIDRRSEEKEREKKKEKKDRRGQYILLIVTLILTAIGLAVPLISNAVADSGDMWYFSIESLKDILGIVFDGLGMICGIPLVVGGRRRNSEVRGIVGISLMAVGIVGAVLVTLFAWLNPYEGVRAYYIIFEIVSIVFAVFGILLLMGYQKKIEE